MSSAQQRARRDRRRLGPVERAPVRPHVGRPHRRCAGGQRLVRQPGRDPQRPGRRQHPGRRLGAHGQHAAGRPRQLMVVVGVPVEHQARRHRERHHDDRGRRVIAISGAVLITGLCPSGDTAWQPTPLATGPQAPNFVVMNENHAHVCTSPEWAEHIQTEILPVLTRDVDLGTDMLEIGPGPRCRYRVAAPQGRPPDRGRGRRDRRSSAGRTLRRHAMWRS